MTVVDKHTSSSPALIKLKIICVAVDVVVDRFNLYIIFFCWDVHNKVKVNASIPRSSFDRYIIVDFAKYSAVPGEEVKAPGMLAKLCTVALFRRVVFCLFLEYLSRLRRH